MKRILLLLICLAGIVGYASCQTREEQTLEYLETYLDNLAKRPEKASEAIRKAAFLAENAYRLDSDWRVIIWYLYVADLVQKEPRSGDIGRYTQRILSFGTEWEDEVESYGITLVTANAAILRAEYVQKAWRPFYLYKADVLLQHLEDSNVAAEAEEDYAPFYALAGLSVSEKEREAMAAYVRAQLREVTPQEWYAVADVLYAEIGKEHDFDGYRQVAVAAIRKAEESGNGDALALYARMLEDGELFKQDLKQAFALYRKAALSGNAWAKVGYCRLAVEERTKQPDYEELFALLSSIRGEADFFRIGGAYQLARLYENGWGCPPDREEAMTLYTGSCRTAERADDRKQAYAAITRLEKAWANQLIADGITVSDVSLLPAHELCVLALRYEGIGEKMEADRYYRLAAGKGDPYSACRLGVKYLSGKNVTEEMRAVAARMFEAGVQGNYAPCLYNYAVMLVYGWGVAPDHDKAKAYYRKYIDWIQAEGAEEYRINEYVSTIGGSFYGEKDTKQGVPLRKVLGNFDNPQYLYRWATSRERDTPRDKVLYFYRRAAEKGHKKAADRLRVLTSD